MLPISKRFWGYQPAAEVFSWILEDLKKSWISSPGSQEVNPFNFEDATFGVNQKNGAINIKPSDYAETSVDDMYSALGGKVTAVDRKENRLSLRLCAYETRLNITDDDDDFISQTLSTRRRGKSTARNSDKLNISNSTSRKRKASNTANDPEFRSTFRPHAFMGPPATPTIPVDSYMITRTVYTVNESGEVEIAISKEIEEIQVSRDWRSHVDSGSDSRSHGFLGQGASKYAILGYVDNKEYAILFLKPGNANVSEVDNKKDLEDELRLLQLGNCFADSFCNRARMYNVEIPKISWNAEGSFLGTIVSPGPTNDDAGEHLPFSTFLATKRLKTSRLHKERKFSGSMDVGQSFDMGGQAMDAFAHHTLVESQEQIVFSDLQGLVQPDKSIILFDPQAHSSNQQTGIWDSGEVEINRWKEGHKCNPYCKGLRLPSTTTSITISKRPLRHGFDS